MSAAIDFSTLTLNVEEARSSNEVIFKKAFLSPQLETVHSVVTGVEMDKYIPILGRYGLMGKSDPGSCGTNVVGEQIPTSQKTWTPKLISFRIVHCQDQLPDLLKFWKKSMIAAKTWEEVDNEMVAFVEDKALAGVNESIIRLADFGDTNASPVGDALGNETLTAGTDKGYFNSINGMWKQIFTDQAAAALGFRYTIPENALATEALQMGLAADRALLAMRKCYDGINPLAFEGGSLSFQMTRELFNNWLAFLEDKSLAFTLTQAETKGGVTGYSYRGIPIVVRHDWSRIIKTYQDLGATLNLPHRLVLADLNNIPVGTSDTESMKTLASGYDSFQKKHFVDVAYKIDMKVLLDEEIASAY